MKRTWIFGFYNLIIILCASQASFATEDLYLTARATFFENRFSRIKTYHTTPFPGLAQFPFWGMLNKNIAALQMGLPIDEAAAINGMNYIYDVCTKAPKIEECGDLQFPLLIRFYSMAHSGGVSSLSPLLENKILAFFNYMIERAIHQGIQPETGIGTWAGHKQSENHIACINSTIYFALLALGNSPAYQQKILSNGWLVSQWALRWRWHWLQYFKERIRRGLLIEVASHTYTKYTLPAFLNFIDFAPNSDMRNLARDTMNLILATGAVETLPNGVRGGSQSRKSPANNSMENFFSSIHNLYVTPGQVAGQTASAFLSSSYYPSRVTWSLWNASNSNSYEVSARTPGVLTDLNSMDVDPTRAAFRTTYVTPNYVFGSAILDFTRNHYANTAAEARSMQLYVNEGNADRTFSDVPQILFQPANYLCYDRGIGIQKKNVLIFQNNIDFFLHGGRQKDICYGEEKVGTTSVVSSTRFDSIGKSIQLDFVLAEKYLSGILGSDSLYDQTRSMADMRINGFTIYSNSRTEGIFLRSINGSTFVWAFPVNSGIKIMDAYVSGSRPITPNGGHKDLVLINDKFSPIVVVVSRGANYGNSIQSFRREMLLNKINYANQQVSITPPLRASLENADVFVDSKSVLKTGDWEQVTDPRAHEAHALVAKTTDAQMSMDLNIVKDGYYHFKARVKGLNGYSDSFYVQLDSMPTATFHFGPRSAEFDWLDMNIFDGKNSVYLRKGLHKVTISQREAGAHFDSFVALYQRNDEPESLVYSENIDRKQPESKFGLIPASQSPLHNQYTHFSPFIRSLRDSGRWEMNYNGVTEVIDIND